MLKRNKPRVIYLAIVLVFTLIILGVYLYFKYKMMAAESGPGYQTTGKLAGKRRLLKPSIESKNCHIIANKNENL